MEVREGYARMITVFENEHIIVVDKPACVLTTPARDAADPRPCLGRALQKELGLQIYPVHRLDFEVSGLVMFAKTTRAHTQAQKWFEHATVVKTYQAVSERLPADAPADWTEWNSKLVRGKRRTFEALHGQPSITRARVVDLRKHRWELQPVTGRPHQLRVEMFRHGAPIAGDTLYGAIEVKGALGIALRAVVLDFSGIAERLGLPARLEAAPLTWPALP
jgi:tRNA pseudouridine32 synthase/23S rRNA pseudouridine746 synthase